MLKAPLLELSPPPPDTTHLVSSYGLLAIAILAEVVATTCMRMAETSQWWRAPAYALYGVSFSLFPAIMTTLSIAVVYATWSAVGSAAMVVISRAFFGETLTTHQLLGVVGTCLSVTLMHIPVSHAE